MTRLVKVWGNTYLNPNCVGKVELTQNFSSGSRTNTTVAYDLTGQHVLLTASTTVACDPPAGDPDSVKRDNFYHQEIIQAIMLARDGQTWKDSPPLNDPQPLEHPPTHHISLPQSPSLAMPLDAFKKAI